MQAVITNVRCNDLVEPIRRLALERHKNKTDEQTPISIYRDVLFLVFTVLGRGNIDQGMKPVFFFFFLFLDWTPHNLLVFIISISNFFPEGNARFARLFAGAFDREYNQSLERLTEKEEKLLRESDAPPTTMALYCRHYFKPLNV